MRALITRLRRRSKGLVAGPNLLFLAALVVLAVLVLMPVGILGYASVLDSPPRPGNLGGQFTWSQYRALTGGEQIRAAGNSLTIGLLGTALAMLWGVGIAWLTARTDIPFRKLLAGLALAPLFLSSLVGALAWSILGAGKSGYINVLLNDLGVPFSINVYSLGGIVFVFGLYYAPYPFLLSYSAFSLLDPQLEEAARVHGAKRSQVLRWVTLPIIRPALLGAVLLTFVLIIENFPVPRLLGTNSGISTLPSLIYLLMDVHGRPNQAAAIGVLLVLVMSLVLWMQRRLIRRHRYTSVSGKGFRPTVMPLGRWKAAAVLFVVSYFVLAVVLPYFALLQRSLRPFGYIANTRDLFDLSVFRFDAFERVVTHQPVISALQNTFVIALLAALVGGIMYFVLTYLVNRTTVPGRSSLEYIAMVPLAVPALVLGLGMLWTWFYLPLPLYGTIWILVFAYIVRFLPQGYQAVSAGLHQIDPDLENVARVSGASRVRAVTFVTVPLLRSSVFAMMALVLILSVRELSAALFLYTPRTRVIAAILYDYWENGLVGEAAVISIIYSVILLVITLAGRRWLGISAVDDGREGKSSKRRRLVRRK